MTTPTPRSVFTGHIRLFAAMALGLASLATLPQGWPDRERGIAAWDVGALCYLVATTWLAYRSTPAHMPARAEAQQDGEWTLFFLVIAGITISFIAILAEFGSMKDAPSAVKGQRIAIVAGTLALSWFLTQAVFALRYAHEYYARSGGSAAVDGGLDFPKEDRPDYWDFLYFSIVLGMTFQVSDVQITARKLRRLATLHGLLGFLFNTVIIALTVNLASSVL